MPDRMKFQPKAYRRWVDLHEVLYEILPEGPLYAVHWLAYYASNLAPSLQIVEQLERRGVRVERLEDAWNAYDLTLSAAHELLKRLRHHGLIESSLLGNQAVRLIHLHVRTGPGDWSWQSLQGWMDDPEIKAEIDRRMNERSEGRIR